MSWNQFSEDRLVELEECILSTLNTPYETFYLPIELKSGTEEKIWTITLNTDSKNIPLVLVHGFAAGIGFWCRNLDALAENRPVYAMDLLGFGRSSRPSFSSDASKAEEEMVEALEAWRKEMKLEKFYLLGHSMGGFLTTSYTLLYPERVLHLILAEPWGFSDHQHEKPSYLSSLIFIMMHIRALEIVRALGPLGPWLIETMRSDLAVKFEGILEDKSVMPNYVYHCNAQNPTGERAFHSMVWGYGWAKNPMIQRIHNLNSEIPITFMYGSDTWIDKSIGQKIKEMRPHSFVEVQIIDDTGHHLYSEQADTFNQIVINACNCVGSNSISESMTSSATSNIVGGNSFIESENNEKNKNFNEENGCIETSNYEKYEICDTQSI